MRESDCKLQAHARGNPRKNKHKQNNAVHTKTCLRERIPVQVWSLTLVAIRQAEGWLKTVPARAYLPPD